MIFFFWRSRPRVLGISRVSAWTGSSRGGGTRRSHTLLEGLVCVPTLFPAVLMCCVNTHLLVLVPINLIIGSGLGGPEVPTCGIGPCYHVASWNFMSPPRLQCYLPSLTPPLFPPCTLPIRDATPGWRACDPSAPITPTIRVGRRSPTRVTLVPGAVFPSFRHAREIQESGRAAGRKPEAAEWERCANDSPCLLYPRGPPAK